MLTYVRWGGLLVMGGLLTLLLLMVYGKLNQGQQAFLYLSAVDGKGKTRADLIDHLLTQVATPTPEKPEK